MSNALDQFLRDHVVGDGEAPSHTSMVGGSWFIPKEEDDNFFRLYIDARDEGKALFFSERILNGCNFQFFVDLDFPSADVVERIIEHNALDDELQFYRRLVVIFEDALGTLTENNIRSILSKKPSATHKIHLNFPTIVCDDRGWAMRAITTLRDAFVRDFRIATCRTLALINWGKVFDSLPYTGGLRMPGSRKNQTERQDDEYSVLDLNSGEFLPLTVEILRDTSIRLESRVAGGVQYGGVQYDGVPEDIPYDVIREYVCHLRRERVFGDLPLSTCRPKRIFDGTFRVDLHDRMCPFKGDRHRRTGVYLHIYISPTGCRLKCFDDDCSSQHVPAELTPQMAGVFDGFVPITLDVSKRERLYLEKLNVPLRITDELRPIMRDLRKTDMTLAQVFVSVFADKFCAVTVGKEKRWMIFRDNIFEPGDDLARLALSFVIGPLYKLFIHQKYHNVYRHRDNGDNEDDDEDDDEEVDLKLKEYRVNAVRAILERLECTSAVTSILAQAGCLFFEEKCDATNRLDAARHLMAFQNGVLDFSVRNSPVFRDGRYSDYLTIRAPTVFRQVEDEKLIEVHGFFVSLFPSPSVRDYVLRVLSKCLSAAEIERMYILTGSGSNGKTKLVRLIQKTFGDYWRDVPVALLTQKRKSSSSAAPEIVDIKGRLILTTQEPEADVKMNAGVVKNFTGNDPISTRQLYGTQVIIEPKATMFMCCNDVPAPSSCDGGVSRRLRVIPFEQKFVANPDPDRSYERKIDDNLDKKIDTWTSAFAYLLFVYRLRYPEPQIEECPEVMLYTKDIEKENDPVHRFAAEVLVELTPGQRGDRRRHTPLETVFNAYDMFCVAHKLRKIARHSFRRRMREVYGLTEFEGRELVVVRILGAAEPNIDDEI